MFWKILVILAVFHVIVLVTLSTQVPFFLAVLLTLAVWGIVSSIGVVILFAFEAKHPEKYNDEPSRTVVAAW